MEHIEISIKDFGAYIKRGDIKSPTWFALDHNLLLHPDFFKVTGDEVKAFLWVIGTAAHLNNPDIRVYPELCASQIRVSAKAVRSSIQKLNGKRWDVTDASRSRTGNSGPALPTEQNKTVHDTTVQDSTGDITTRQNSEGHNQGPRAAAGVTRLIEIWNEHRGELPPVKRITDPRARKIKSVWPKLKESEWVEVVKMVAKSKFLNGKTERGTWCAGFDWLISNSRKDGTANYVKVFEGNYSDRPKSRPVTERPAELDMPPKEAKDIREALGGMTVSEAIKKEQQKARVAQGE